MPTWNRREWMAAVGAGLAAPMATMHEADARAEATPAAPPKVTLDQFQPKSMLHVPETRVERARFPVIDVHAHLTSARGEQPETVRTLALADELLAVMDRRNVRAMVNLTGGRGAGLAEALRTFDGAHPGRFLTFTEPWWSRAHEPGYATFQGDEIARAHKAGARGLKVLKMLGLYLRAQGKTGPLVTIDDRRFDPMWEACGALGMPVAIHIADPEAFFLPTDRFNERFEELQAHPDWSFHGRDFPSFRSLLEARDRVYERHPQTTFIGLHVGHHAEDLEDVGRTLDRFPNVHVELGARIGELGRQPRASRRFFDKYQDRILFGTDAVPNGHETPQQVFGDDLYRIYYRFLETADEYFDYAPAPIPPQGRWRIYGLELPEPILKKVYHQNAERLLGL